MSGEMAIVPDDPSQHDGTDFTLVQDSAWITVKGFSVYLKKTDEGVVVDIYKRDGECDDPVASTYAYDGEEGCGHKTIDEKLFKKTKIAKCIYCGFEDRTLAETRNDN